MFPVLLPDDVPALVREHCPCEAHGRVTRAILNDGELFESDSWETRHGFIAWAQFFLPESGALVSLVLHETAGWSVGAS